MLLRSNYSLSGRPCWKVEFQEDPKARVRVKYYDYGVLSVLVDFPFAGAWPDFVSLASPLDFWRRPAEPCREDRKGKSSANPAGLDRTLRKKRLARSGLKP